MTTNRERALSAAVRLVGEHGVRALTHMRVDAEAGLPKGSTSNWFRTRDALVAGVVVSIAEQERADLTAAMAPARTIDEVIDVLARLLEDATGCHATRTRARYALFFETTATPGVGPSVRAQRSLFEDWMRERLTELGAADPDSAARAVLAMSAGIIVNRLTVAPDTPIRPAIELTMRGCFSRRGPRADPPSRKSVGHPTLRQVGRVARDASS